MDLLCERDRATMFESPDLHRLALGTGGVWQVSCLASRACTLALENWLIIEAVELSLRFADAVCLDDD